MIATRMSVYKAAAPAGFNLNIRNRTNRPGRGSLRVMRSVANCEYALLACLCIVINEGRLPLRVAAVDDRQPIHPIG